MSLYLLTLVSVCALGWFGWRLLEQERLVETQRTQERMEQEADRLTASVRSALAETAEKLGVWQATEIAPPRIPNGVLLMMRDDTLTVTPSGRLLYYPFPSSEPEADAKVFAEAEMFEFAQSQPTEALHGYERLAASPNPAIRAGALLRMARILRTAGHADGSKSVYVRLAAIPGVRVAGVPAELLGRMESAVLAASPAQAESIRQELANGRWHLTRGQFHFYWAESGRLAKKSDPPPTEAAVLSEVANHLWETRSRNSDVRGQETIWAGGQPYFLLWRGAADSRAVLIAPPEVIARQAVPPGIHYALVDPEGRTLAGDRIARSRAVVRTAAETRLPWTLYVSAEPVSRAESAVQQRFLLLGIFIMVLFLVLGTLFIARAIHREAELLRMQSDFVSAVSHEFRSPLTTMRQLSEILLLGRAPSEERRHLYYEMMVKETTRLQRVVEALLQFGRMEAGARKYHFQELDAAALVRRVVTDFEQQIAGTGRHVEVLDPGAPCWIDADPEALTVALRNLLDNAVKYSPDQPTVWVDCGVKDRRVTIAVKDHGLGIADSEKKAIFRKFVRGSAASTSNAKGSGVGLAMVRHIVAAHGGEITLASKKGEGTTFTLWLPSAAKA
ncbi:MAG: HAMP domain-containing histidine kinase [Acidobacteria bacterium]|nr:HAMP domain-containing histidine kinase [Acidobacteriota bacterium]